MVSISVTIPEKKWSNLVGDLWLGISRGMIIGTTWYHANYSLATKYQTGMTLHWFSVARLAPLTGVRTAAREFYRAPVRNSTRAYMQTTTCPKWFIEATVGVAAGAIDAFIMSPLDMLRIRSSVTGRPALGILRELTSSPIQAIPNLYVGVGGYFARNMLVWPVLLPVGGWIQSKIQSLHPDKPLNYLEHLVIAFTAGFSAAAASNLPEIKRTQQQAGVNWVGYRALVQQRGVGVLTAGLLVRAIQYTGTWGLAVSTQRSVKQK
eukprot:NODE_1716_length_1837_cov_42.357643_g1456_i0.p1 GENE.NODE_1716_length_1837_cov_42.357643_g1456_i0~~NODE_1716_length_1837_cov_42.357643_g1456_i0.p1  ORF type:complete len:264 (-),score=20.72 NODE_1716_length_1837_cov_42.357643_g1456_i0:984-1775(-)